MKAGWQTKSLGDVLEKTETVNPLQSPETEFDYIDVSSVSNTTFQVEQTQRLKGKDAPSRARKLVKTDDVIFATIRPTLRRIAIVPPHLDKQVCSTGYFVLRPKPFLDHRFMYYWLFAEEFMGKMEALQKGASYPAVTDKEVRDQAIPFPSLPEQQRIVTLLDESFDGIAIARANASKNLQNARAIFESQREVLLSFKPGWLEAPLAELCDVKHGYAFDGEFFAPDGDYVLLTAGSFFETGGYRERGEKTKFFVGQIPSDYILDAGDLLVAMTEQAAGLLGSPLLVPESNRFLHNQRLGLVAGKTGVPWLNEFFFHVFNLGRIRQEIHGSASGVKVRHTSPGRIGAVKVAYPKSVAEQNRVTTQLGDLSEECERLESLNQRKLTALDELKKSLLHRAFDGDL
ncbi:MAG: restriction endonuclease subunit S [Betaproteobacteria bacterium]